MTTLNKQINSAFHQSLSTLSKRYKIDPSNASMYLQFLEKESKLFFYSPKIEPKPINFTDMIGSKMIGLGLTIEKVYMALHWLKSVVETNFNVTQERLSFLLFSTARKNLALIGVCINGKHKLSYHFSDVIKQFNSKQEHLN